jgi:signal peptidase II
LIVAGTLIVADQVSKIWAASYLANRDVNILGSFRLHLTRNSGASFSVAEGKGAIFGVFAIAVSIGLIMYLPKQRDRASAIALGAIIGGAVGNVIDRGFRVPHGFLTGHVVDFLDLQWWPIFNVADVGVVCGGITLTLLSLRRPLTTS